MKLNQKNIILTLLILNSIFISEQLILLFLSSAPGSAIGIIGGEKGPIAVSFNYKPDIFFIMSIILEVILIGKIILISRVKKQGRE
jgi:hypothetical protein